METVRKIISLYFDIIYFMLISYTLTYLYICIYTRPDLERAKRSTCPECRKTEGLKRKNILVLNFSKIFLILNL